MRGADRGSVKQTLVQVLVRLFCYFFPGGRDGGVLTDYSVGFSWTVLLCFPRGEGGCGSRFEHKLTTWQVVWHQ